MSSHHSPESAHCRQGELSAICHGDALRQYQEMVYSELKYPPSDQNHSSLPPGKGMHNVFMCVLYQTSKINENFYSVNIIIDKSKKTKPNL
jgi:hypothetical protein